MYCISPSCSVADETTTNGKAEDRHAHCRYLPDEVCRPAADPRRARVRRLGVREALALRRRAGSERARLAARGPAGARALRELLALDRERRRESRRRAVPERPRGLVHA